MRLSALLTAPTLSFASYANAASIPRQDPHVLDFRTWASKDSGADNQGIWTFTQSDVTPFCRSFASYGADNVQSLTLVDINSQQPYALQVFYASDNCSTEGDKYDYPEPEVCYSSPEGSLRSFRFTTGGADGTM